MLTQCNTIPHSMFSAQHDVTSYRFSNKKTQETNPHKKRISDVMLGYVSKDLYLDVQIDV